MSQAVPKLVQRFRARELQRLVEQSGLRDPRHRERPFVKLKQLRSDVSLHNPFLPRPLFNRDANPERSRNSDTGESAVISSGTNAKIVRSTETPREKKERKKWVEARYSLRRQAVLVKQARASGTLHLLPPGPKLSVEELEAAKREAREHEEAAHATAQEAALEVDVSKDQSVETENISVGSEDKASEIEEASRSAASMRSLSRHQRRRHVAALGYPDVVFNWTGKVPTKTRKGLTIYAGRRRMFKGHKWERLLDKRRGQIAVRMRDMSKRIKRFKNVYKRRRPNPLKPATPRKKESLPY